MCDELWNNEEPIREQFEDIKIPAWIDQGITPNDIMAIMQGGCSSGAYMPAVEYYTARQTMDQHGDDVLDYLQLVTGELPAPSDEESWSGMAVHYLSHAVEVWAAIAGDQLIETLEEAV